MIFSNVTMDRSSYFVFLSSGCSAWYSCSRYSLSRNKLVNTVSFAVRFGLEICPCLICPFSITSSFALYISILWFTKKTRRKNNLNGLSFISCLTVIFLRSQLSCLFLHAPVNDKADPYFQALLPAYPYFPASFSLFSKNIHPVFLLPDLAVRSRKPQLPAPPDARVLSVPVLQSIPEASFIPSGPPQPVHASSCHNNKPRPPEHPLPSAHWNG